MGRPGTAVVGEGAAAHPPAPS